MIINIIRHGKTFANENKLYCGSTDLPLSDRGREEIADFKEQGIYPEPGLLFTSSLLRAGQTAEIIFGDTKKTALADLNEYDFGDFEMISFEELNKLENFRMWLEDKTGEVECPGGENMNRFERRVARGFDTVIDAVGAADNAVTTIVTHGGVIVRIMETLFPGTRNYYEWQPETGRGYTVTIGNDNTEYKEMTK